MVRSPALCGGVRDTSCRARRSSSWDAPLRRRPAHPVRPTGSQRSRTRSARRSSSSTPPSRRSRGRAQSAVRLERRRQALDARLARTRRHVAVVRSSLDATNQRVADLLRRLYVEGDADPIAVLLGARSLPAMLAGLDELERTTHANRGIAAELRARSRTLRAQLVRLAQVRRQLTDAERRAGAALAASERAAASRRATVASIGRRAGVTRARLAAIEARVKAAQRASARIERKSVPAPPSLGPRRRGAAAATVARRAGHAHAGRRRGGVPPAGQDGQRASGRRRRDRGRPER